MKGSLVRECHSLENNLSLPAILPVYLVLLLVRCFTTMASSSDPVTTLHPRVGGGIGASVSPSWLRVASSRWVASASETTPETAASAPASLMLQLLRHLVEFGYVFDLLRQVIPK